MKRQLKMIFKSSNFLIGFVIFASLLLTSIFYPILSTTNPLEMVGGLFYKPGTYINVTDAIDAKMYKMDIDVLKNKLARSVGTDELTLMLEWFTKSGSTVDISKLDVNSDASEIISLWLSNYDSEIRLEGTSAYRKSFVRLYDRLENILSSEGYTVTTPDSALESGSREIAVVNPQQFVNTRDIVNKKTFLLGTDNFGRDMVSELISAIGTSMRIGFIAGTIATIIGLLIGLLAGYVGGLLDNVLTFITNMFTVIPSFIILILISVSLSQGARDVTTTAVVIGITAWPWTARSVRSQTLTLKNRDHVNISKLSGHRLGSIIMHDILPYVASYVVMAYILQISSGILAEAQLSMLGLGPSTTKIATLGLMMNWAMQFQAPTSGAWWAFIPVVLSIALISFSLNLMNTGLDQVFNPTLRD